MDHSSVFRGPGRCAGFRRLTHLAITLFALALAACGGGGGGGAGTPAPAPPPDPPPAPVDLVTIAGRVTFDLVPPDESTDGLDYGAVVESPVRLARVQAVDGGNTVLASVDTSTSGDYEIQVPADTDVRIRVRAQMERAGVPFWDFSVVDNTSGKAIYALDGELTDSGAADSVRNLHALSGWDGSAYTSPRSAAPFAILDAVYDAFNLVLDFDPSAVFPALTLNWSENNVPVDGDLGTGEIGTSFFSGGEIYLLGAANNDTDEYDRHIVIHEWGHYFEDTFSRADSIGGSHGAGDRLDARVAFSEGFGYAFAGMATGDPVTRDSSGDRQGGGFQIDVERNNNVNPGWYSEGSVQSILYDLYDGADDGLDSVTLGFGPLLDVLTGEQRNTDLLTTIFTFVPPLKERNPTAAAGIDALVAGQDIRSVDMDGLGSTEQNDASNGDVLPVYSALAVDGPAVEVCNIADFGLFNKLSNRRYLHTTVADAGNYRIVVAGPPGSDPDFALYRGGLLLLAETTVSGREEVPNPDAGGPNSGPLQLPGGDYVLEVYNYDTMDRGRPARACMDVTIERE